MDTSDSSQSDPPKEVPLSPGSSVSSQFQNDYEDFVTMAVTALSQTKQQLLEDNKTLKASEEEVVENIPDEKAASEKWDRSFIPPIVLDKSPLEKQLQLEETFSNQEELNRLENIVDGWSYDLKRNILAEYNQTKCKLQSHVRKLVEEEKSRLHDSVESLRNQIVSLQELCSSYQEALDRKTKMVDNMSEELAKQKDKVALAQKFSDWKQKKEEKKREDFCEAIATRYYKDKILRNFLKTWKLNVEESWTARFEKRNQHKAQEVCRQLAADYEEKLKQLKFETTAAKEETERVRQDYTNLENQMRNAVLRGVSALNMETMAAFHSGGQPVRPSYSPGGEVTEKERADTQEGFSQRINNTTISEPEEGNLSLTRQVEADDVPREPKLLLSSEMRHTANHHLSDMVTGGFEYSTKTNGYHYHELPSSHARVFMNGDRISPMLDEKLSNSLDDHHLSKFKDPSHHQFISSAPIPPNSTNDDPRFLSYPGANQPYSSSSAVEPSNTSPYSKPLVTQSGPSRTVSARDDARRLLSSRAATASSPSQRSARSYTAGNSSLSVRDRGSLHTAPGVLTVQANNPAGSAYHSSSAAAAVLVEKHQPVNKHTIGPVITQHRMESPSTGYFDTISHTTRRTFGQPVANQ